MQGLHHGHFGHLPSASTRFTQTLFMALYRKSEIPLQCKLRNAVRTMMDICNPCTGPGRQRSCEQ